MVKIERFEEIQSWQKARELVKNIYEITSQGDFIRDYGLKDQLRRASVSVMSNIAEGFARQTKSLTNTFIFLWALWRKFRVNFISLRIWTMSRGRTLLDFMN